ncbi:adenine phosphoribosyltransferase [Salinigranum rubrum]|uniref:HGPRTase-like protein n=1 Tax=Salinigranum rubrum TaxID=755307 RepID=A0A2I8VKG5_9EURY|nr:hypoxanthine/guanine phosphoribosyltransferase [Salinigranum rubrum]AUV82416.1 adenine phosphoribosyltransferase [Salinigranum rubrum]
MDRLRRSFDDAPIIEKEGGYQYVVHPISNGVPMLRPELLREVVIGVMRVADLARVDKIVTPEAMGIHISTAVSLMTDIPLVVIRKREYGLDGEVSLHQQTGYSESEMYINDVEPGDRVLVLDDLLSTGGTLAAVTEALADIGADIVDTVVVVRKADTDSAMDEKEYDVTSLIDIELVDGEVVVRDEYRRRD